MKTFRELAKTSVIIVGLLGLWAATPLFAQEPVPVGRGSYAQSLPPDLQKTLGKTESAPLYFVKEDGRPLPTNQWWSQLAFNRFGRTLFSFPMNFTTSEQGLDIALPVRWLESGSDLQCDQSLVLTGKDFTPADARAKDWSDWLLTFRMAQSPERYMDVTIGRGMPYAWVEMQGIDPVLNLPTKLSPGELRFFDRTGKTRVLPATMDALGIEYQNRRYGIFAPEGTIFSASPAQVQVKFAATVQQRYLVIAALPTARDIERFYPHAYAVPRQTRMNWKYDAAAGTLTTQWTITTQPLRGTEQRIFQGWLPHHLRTTTHQLTLDGPEYQSPRGKLRCALGNQFEITYHFTGLIPVLPAPKNLGGEHDFSPQRMQQYFADLSKNLRFGADTYWGGKDLLRAAQCSIMAQQLGDDATSQKFRDELRSALSNWFNYTPAESEHYFAYYPRFKGLVGVKPSYGSDAFNDQHFHYGYFTFASALMMMNDPQFTADFGPMAKVISKAYANSDRNDARFPFLRTFDIWEGHSWASGVSSQGGNNQESSSEAVQSWAGLIYLGRALRDADMIATGVMGYCMESQAAMEYWFNQHGDNFPPQYKPKICSILWSGGKQFATYFSGDPAWVYGIQWFPATPAISYLVRDPAFARKSFSNMWSDWDKSRPKKKPAPEKEFLQPDDGDSDAPSNPHVRSVAAFDAGVINVILGYALMFDPQWVAQQLDELYARPNDNVTHNAADFATVYYQAHAMRKLGDYDWTIRSDCPTAMTFRRPDGQRTFVVWNPTASPEIVQFFEGDQLLGHVTAPPRSLTPFLILQ